MHILFPSPHSQLHPHPSCRMEVLQKPALLAPLPRLHPLHCHSVRPSSPRPLLTRRARSYSALHASCRYSSIAVITLSNVGYFGSFFTLESCNHYYMAAPIFKVVQTMVSQMILGIRTINISRRSNVVTWIVVSVFLTFTSAQWFLNMWNRTPVQGRHNNCTAGNRPPVLTVWLYYLLSMAYDILTLGISTVYLISFNPKSGKMAHLVRMYAHV
ncbi:hypothetical protein NUW54_g13945 [Trametes sanguinea]|uniref:Uncharacterized protein n=1 Tax=Trametes sanguinea TaxID=158606 RepID=A0ACC1MHZ5_9APHY|nr:hypothetical protein NUW54_g13945 [Trametes sanguinea]